MSSTAVNRKIFDTINRITEKMERIEENLAWLIPASRRFKKGQRVQLSDKAVRQHIGSRCKTRRGTVVAVSDSFDMQVHLDGYKHPSGFHHSFFDPLKKQR